MNKEEKEKFYKEWINGKSNGIIARKINKPKDSVWREMNKYRRKKAVEDYKKGLSLQEIAEKHKIAVSTVKRYRRDYVEWIPSRPR